MSVLSVIATVCGRTNVPVPTTVLGNTDTQIVQMLRLLEEEGNDLAQRGDWNALTYEATLTTLAAEDQGATAVPYRASPLSLAVPIRRAGPARVFRIEFPRLSSGFGL